MNSARKSRPKCKMLTQPDLRARLVCCLLGLFLVSISDSQSAPPSPASDAATRQSGAEIRAVLQAQQEAWNRGDLDAFMNGYARSESTVLVSDDTVTRGGKSARDRYKIKYRSRAKMGKLRFSDLDIQSLGNEAAVVLGRWALKRANGVTQGHFTLVFRRTPDGWRIVHDHTSTAGGAQ